MKKYLLGSLVLVGLSSQAFAMHHHEAVETGGPNAGAPCVFPDGTSPKGRQGIHCYTPSQFLEAYGIDQLHKLGLTGKGQTIILADSYGSPTLQADLDHFSDTFGIARTTIQFIYPNGVYVNPMTTADQAGWAQETTLDLEWAHAIAPDATLVNIVTSSDESTGMSGLQDLFNGIQMAAEKYPNAIISMSFGTGESTFLPSDIPTYLQGSLHQILENATAAGVTLLASAGDQGSDNINTAQTKMLAFPDASYPATDPLITAVGGTAIEYNWKWTPQGTADDYWACQVQIAAKKITTCPKNFMSSVENTSSTVETVWKEDFAIAAGGGGVSKVFEAPDFQAGLSPEVQKIMGGHRAIPDVSMNAAINGGVDVYTSFVSTSQGIPKAAWQSFGGTSCASPETAALIALAGEQASNQLGKVVGIGALNPIIYNLDAQADFNDVVSQTFGASRQVVIDNNALYFNASALAVAGATHMPPVDVPGYETTAGYDLATGFGSPKAVNFVLDVASARVAREVLGKTQLSER